MKQFATSVLVLALSLGDFAQQNTWPSALGNVSFATDSTWTISGNGIFQIWSDAVQTDSCSNKTSFESGDRAINGYAIDCRSNPHGRGDLFSFSAVSVLGHELCPYPWRAPIKDDFIALDRALGGTGYFQRTLTHFDRYFNSWGATFNHEVYSLDYDFQPFNHTLVATYWSQSEYVGVFCEFICGVSLSLYPNGFTNPQSKEFRGFGFALRCVRDN